MLSKQCLLEVPRLPQKGCIHCCLGKNYTYGLTCSSENFDHIAKQTEIELDLSSL